MLSRGIASPFLFAAIFDLEKRTLGIGGQETEWRVVQGAVICSAGHDKVRNVDVSADLSPVMKVFAWRGPHATVEAANGARRLFPNAEEAITKVQPSVSTIEVAIGGAVIKFPSNTDPTVLIDVLGAVRKATL
jgi:hypothetical protein